MNKYEQSDIVEDHSNFLNKRIKKLKRYIVEFNKDSTIKLKVYLSNYIIKSKNQ